ncbi:MAG: HD domain-containing protein [Phycisphaerae bacterium]|nr:HD domain-containing protein [Phycisphaerae bacterium]
MSTVQSTQPNAAVRAVAKPNAATSSRAGYLPIPLNHIPLHTLNEISVYLKARPGTEPAEDAGEKYSLYSSGVVPFTEADRTRLRQNGVRFIYVRMADQPKLQRQLEACLATMAADKKTPSEEAAALVYETSFELMNEVLADPTLSLCSDSVRNVCQAVSAFVINHRGAFSQLYSAARHDFYTATHLVNVATWMVPIAYEMGYRDDAELTRIGQAGLLHDVGKVRIAPEIIGKAGKLTDEEFAEIQRHAQFGYDIIKSAGWTDELICAVAQQHHERQDGSGYPEKRTGDEIHVVSRICAVADSFDAMTALRPYKDRALTVPEAMAILQSESPDKYDPDVVSALVRLTDPAAASAKEGSSEVERRAQPRFAFRVPARVFLLNTSPLGPQEHSGFVAVTRDLSRVGLGLNAPRPLDQGQPIRVYLKVRAPGREHLDGVVARCRSLEDGSFEIGVQFIAESAELTNARAGGNDC